MHLVSYMDSDHIAPKCGFFFRKSRKASLLSRHCFLYFWKWSSESFFMSRSTIVGLTTKWWALSAWSLTVTKWFLLIHFSLKEKIQWEVNSEKFKHSKTLHSLAVTELLECYHEGAIKCRWSDSVVLQNLFPVLTLTLWLVEIIQFFHLAKVFLN